MSWSKGDWGMCFCSHHCNPQKGKLSWTKRLRLVLGWLEEIRWNEEAEDCGENGRTKKIINVIDSETLIY